ncbi:MAG: hypothetical protein M5U09_30575, partial [Gammaproteobacteria bacterium]|nr:hypothetical protein [Gammaproteobacteria bacterium]
MPDDAQRRDLLLHLLTNPGRPAAMVAFADRIARHEPVRAGLAPQSAAAPDTTALVAGEVGRTGGRPPPYAAGLPPRRSPLLAGDPAAQIVIRESEALYPDPSVTVFVVARDATETIGPVLAALGGPELPGGAHRGARPRFGRRYGSSGCRGGRGRGRPALGHDRGRGPASGAGAVRDAAAGLPRRRCDAVGDLAESFYLHFRHRELRPEGVDQGAPLGAVFGTALETEQGTVAGLWRARHAMRYFAGRKTVDEVPWLYACNLLGSRDALRAAGGWDLCRPKVAELLLSAGMRREGYRLAYDAEAQCRRLGSCTLAEALDSAVGHQSAYVWQRSFAQYESGGLPALLAQLPETVERYRLELVIDQHFHLRRLAYSQLPPPPWLVFADFRLAAEQAAADDAVCLRQTHAALWLGLFPVWESLGAPGELLDRLAVDLAPAAPQDAELAELCSPAGAQAQRSAASTGFSPLDMLSRRDHEAVVAHLRGMAAEWNFDSAELGDAAR